MLNYIWLALIVIGITVAVWGDVHDFSTGKYHNGEEFSVTLSLTDSTNLQPAQPYPCSITATDIGAAERGELIPNGSTTGILHIYLDDKAPALWKDIMKAQKNSDYLLARIRWTKATPQRLNGFLAFDPVKFVRMSAVTNDGIVRYARTAVELCIGLIGIMALWLGIMKIAEQAGLIAKLAKALKPIMTRLFPDVPSDHPAMGAMIMNISANMLGLANAATPLGLKAMEELNKLNPKAGTATDAMCTFLVINTSNVQLIPATVIAIRAAGGSANPAEIIGPVLVATAAALLVGVITAKLLARLPVFKRQLR